MQPKVHFKSFHSRTTAFVFAMILSCTTTANAQQLRFELPNCSGRTISIESGQSQATAICFLGTQCPMAKSYATILSKLQKEFGKRGVRIVGVMSNTQDSKQDVEQYIDSLDVTFEVLIDSGHQIADQFGAQRTPEVYLLDQGLKTRYHGRIDDQFAPSVARASATREDLRIAIEELLAGKPVSVKETSAMGCVIGRTKTTKSIEEASVTYYREVLPLLQAHCIECHRQGEIGPFQMDAYGEVVGWAETMLETMDDGRMPPWHADQSVGQFANARHLPDEAREMFRAWIAEGCPEGDPTDAPESPTFDSGWHLAETPDLVLPMRSRPFVVPKDGVIEYQYFVVDPGFEEDKWFEAAQILPGSRDVVHHAIVFVRPPDGVPFEGVGWLTAYVPGQRSIPFPEGFARKIPAGSKLVFQMHYTPNGIRREDLTKLAIKFADESTVTHRLISLVALNQEFEIPPNSDGHSVTAKLRGLPEQSQLLAITPHMHYRGKSFEAFATPRSSEAKIAGTEEATNVLLRVPNYDFNWQHTYMLENPIAMDQLQGVSFNVTFDNSSNNPFNPNPEEAVTWGDQTWEEMALAFFEVAIPREAAGKMRRSRNQNDVLAKEKVAAYVERVLAKMDDNQDGKIEESEGSVFVRHFNFRYFDSDGDGTVTREELEELATKLYD